MLSASLSVPCVQVLRLQELVKEGEQGMGTAEGHITNLKEAQDKLAEELDATRARLRETSNLLTALQVRALLQRTHANTNPHTHTQTHTGRHTQTHTNRF